MEDEPKALRGDPYKWETVDLPRDVSKLWEDVAKGIDKNQTGTLLFRHGHVPSRRINTRILRRLVLGLNQHCDSQSLSSMGLEYSIMSLHGFRRLQSLHDLNGSLQQWMSCVV
jgi:hypothetical protein